MLWLRPVTDLRIGHGLGPRATPSYDDSLLTQEFAKLHRGIISQFTSKRAKDFLESFTWKNVPTLGLLHMFS